jgi:glycine cleavage system regulatory protein
VSTFLVLTVIADDKPGIVESLSNIVAEQGGNWLESRMSHMAGKFAGILRVSIPAIDSTKLTKALQALESEGMRIQIEESAEKGEQLLTEDYCINLVGNDRPGIMKEVTQALSRHGVNVLELTTNCSIAPMSGDVLFNSVAHLRVPKGVNIGDLETDLENISNDLIVDIDLEESK